MRAFWRLAGACAVIGLLALGAMWWLGDFPARQATAPPTEPFQDWKRKHARDVDRYQVFLRQQGVADVLAMEELLRLGRRWKTCGSGEFSVPPPEKWRAIVPTLRLLADLRKSGHLERFRIASSYRGAAYNRCEGGSQASRHLSNQALDLDLSQSSKTSVAALCAAWRRIGPSRSWGLGFYSSNQVHLDTAGFRTWGTDFHGKTSLCNRRD